MHPSLDRFRAPIQIFTPSPAAEAHAREFQQSFILYDIVGWGPKNVEHALFHMFDQY